MKACASSACVELRARLTGANSYTYLTRVYPNIGIYYVQIYSTHGWKNINKKDECFWFVYQTIALVKLLW